MSPSPSAQFKITWGKQTWYLEVTEIIAAILFLGRTNVKTETKKLAEDVLESGLQGNQLGCETTK